MYSIRGLSSSMKKGTHLLIIHMQNDHSGATFNLMTPFTVSTSKEDILTFIEEKMNCEKEKIKIAEHVNFATVGILT